MTTAIVAIPAKDDYVWKLSSEKVPHMTLLVLGELSGEEKATALGFLEHAVDTSLRRFGMTVDRRGTLGPKEADVLFFEQTWSEDIKSFIGYLLQEDRIKTAFDSIEQFEGWTPHLTLGYPDTPAHEDDRDYPGVHYVQFDRVAMWDGNYEGPEFELMTNTDLELKMSNTTHAGEVLVGEYLAQYGVKGMKWGVRKDRGHEGQRAKTKKIEKLDRKFDQDRGSLKTHVKLMNMAREQGQKDLDAINAKAVYKKAADDGALLSDTPVRRKYYKEVQDSYVKNLNKAAKEYGTNASGTKQYKIVASDYGLTGFAISLQDVKHSIEDDKIELKMVTDDSGLVVDFEEADPVKKILAHYGVKGMKWGVRKDRKAQNARFGKARKKEENASDDHKMSRAIKKKPIHSLSNKELEALNKRLNLERNLKSLDPDAVTKGKKNVDRILDTIGTGVKLMNSPIGKTAVTVGSVLVTKKVTSTASKSASDAFLERLKDL